MSREGSGIGWTGSNLYSGSFQYTAKPGKLTPADTLPVEKRVIGHAGGLLCGDVFLTLLGERNASLNLII